MSTGGGEACWPVALARSGPWESTADIRRPRSRILRTSMCSAYPRRWPRTRAGPHPFPPPWHTLRGPESGRSSASWQRVWGLRCIEPMREIITRDKYSEGGKVGLVPRVGVDEEPELLQSLVRRYASGCVHGRNCRCVFCRLLFRLRTLLFECTLCYGIWQ